METQSKLFDDIATVKPIQPVKNPEQAKREAIKLATKGANEAFLLEARRLLKEEILPRHQFFSARLFWAVYNAQERPQTSNGRALGGVMSSLASEGYMQATEKREKSGRVSDHNQLLMVWESLIFEG